MNAVPATSVLATGQNHQVDRIYKVLCSLLLALPVSAHLQNAVFNTVQSGFVSLLNSTIVVIGEGAGVVGFTGRVFPIKNLRRQSWRSAGTVRAERLHISVNRVQACAFLLPRTELVVIQ